MTFRFGKTQGVRPFPPKSLTLTVLTVAGNHFSFDHIDRIYPTLAVQNDTNPVIFLQALTNLAEGLVYMRHIVNFGILVDFKLLFNADAAIHTVGGNFIAIHLHDIEVGSNFTAADIFHIQNICDDTLLVEHKTHQIMPIDLNH